MHRDLPRAVAHALPLTFVTLLVVPSYEGGSWGRLSDPACQLLVRLAGFVDPRSSALSPLDRWSVASLRGGVESIPDFSELLHSEEFDAACAARTRQAGADMSSFTRPNEEPPKRDVLTQEMAVTAW
ncbi:MAG TPA: hypothetical protein VFQ61_05550 [Polyangiaceae bacterium]|nr:hypothetical protein [Polyangiaceae bacterium]